MFELSSRLIRALVLVLPLCAAPVPAPEAWFGHPMGADRKLIPWNQVVSYFEALGKNSDRLRFEVLGQTAGGRPFIAATIAASETLRDLGSFRDIQAHLADPRRTTPGEAEKLIARGKTLVLITCSVHSTEVASTMTAVEFAYKLLTEDKPKFRTILANTIILLVPSLNPDGVDIVRDWYTSTLGTPYEGTSPPELYHKYVGHDNNRDWYIFSQPETRLTVSRLHNVWHPQIVYDVHQQGAYASRMFVPPWLDPVDPNVDPIIVQLSNSIGATMASDLTATGRKGVAINALYDFWTPSRHYQAYHGGVRILSESASARLASPLTVKPEDINQNALGYNPRERSWNYLEPWTGGEWRVRDIVNDQLVTMESCLYQAAVRREDLLRYFYRAGQKAISRTDPEAFVVSSAQRDPGAARTMLETLHFGQVEIGRVQGAFTADSKEYPAGSYIIRMQQPYSAFAKTLLEKQDYPDLRLYPGGPPRRPYDVTAHTLPLLMGVAVNAARETLNVSPQPADAFEFTGDKLSAADTDTWLSINTAWRRGQAVFRNPVTGDFALNHEPGLKRLRRPRVALYKSFVPSMDEGWTRWLLEKFGWEFTSIRNRDIVHDNLNSRFDVIVFPDMQPASIQGGYRSGSMPSQFTGGVGDNGAAALRNFASRGGTVVFLNDSSDWATQHLGLNVRNVLSGVSNREFYAPGSLLNVTRSDNHWLTLGMPKDFSVWFESGPAFELSAGTRDQAVLSYPESKVLASGWLLGEKYLHRRAALVDAGIGSGHVVLFGMRPQYRAQSYLAFKLFFNSLLYSE